MPRGRKRTPLTVCEAARTLLQGVANSITMPDALVLRTRMILAGVEGLTNTAVARRVGASPQTVGKWRKRYLDIRIQGLHDELCPGRPRTYDDERVARVINRALQDKPPNTTHWSTHSMVAAEGISASTVSRWFHLLRVKPHLSKTFKLSTDPFFIEKVRDITGLYLNLPDHAMVLCVDEKLQSQALNQTQPKLPMDLGYAEGHTHAYLRHGTTTLFAALNIATGKVIAKWKARHRHQEVLAFLRLINKVVPADLDIHPALDNCATHKHAAVKHRLAERPHFTPTYSLWLNQVVRWFGLLSEQVLKRGRSRSVRELVDQTRTSTEGHQRHEAVRTGCDGSIHPRKSRAYIQKYF